MRRRAGDVGDAARVQPCHVIARALLRAPTAPSIRRRSRRAGISAGRHSGGCRRTSPRSRSGARAGPSAMMAPASPSSVCPTIFGAPDVPEVSISHSVARSVLPCRGRSVRQAGGDDQLRAGIGPSVRPIGDDGIDLGVRNQRAGCAGSRSGGHSSMRRATPSSSIMASAGLQLVRRRQQHRSAGQLARICRSGQLCRECRSAIRSCRASEIVRPFSSGPR